MRHPALAVAFALLAAAAAAPALGQNPPPPSVLVTTEPPRHGSLPRTRTAYGVVQASPDGTQTLSLLRAGQVLRVAVTPGQQVHRGDPLVVVSADPAALSAYRQAIAALDLAKGQRTRMTQMLAQRLATRDQVAQADNAVANAQATLDTLDRAGGGAAEQTVTAPFDGIVSSLLVAPGARVAAQTPLATVARLDRLEASVGIEPDSRGLVAAGQPVSVFRLGGDAAPIPGSVRAVGAMLDPLTRLVPVLVALTPAAGTDTLLPGEPVRAVLQVGDLKGWLVPRNALLADATGPSVFQVDGAKAVRVGVQVVGTAGGTTVVAGPLDPARPLVTSGNYQLQDGVAVRLGPAKP